MQAPWIMALLLAATAGCSAAPTSVPDTNDTHASQDSASLTDRAEMAATLLAKRLQVPRDSVEIVRVERVTWPNGAAGCPRPGMVYTQALIDGYRVILAQGGREHAYHGVAGAEPFYCARPEPPGRWIMDR